MGYSGSIRLVTLSIFGCHIECSHQINTGGISKHQVEGVMPDADFMLTLKVPASSRLYYTIPRICCVIRGAACLPCGKVSTATSDRLQATGAPSWANYDAWDGFHGSGREAPASQL
jgi:hypothetical protein